MIGKGVGNWYSERQRDLTTHPDNVPADRGKILLQQVGMFSGGGMTRRAWDVAADSGASPGAASVLAAVKVLADRASAPDGNVRRPGTKSSRISTRITVTGLALEETAV